MMTLKEIAFANDPNLINPDADSEYKRGFSPIISVEDIGKYVIVYRKENTLVKGTRPYNTKEEAQKLLDLMDDPNIVIKRIAAPRGNQ